MECSLRNKTILLSPTAGRSVRLCVAVAIGLGDNALSARVYPLDTAMEALVALVSSQSVFDFEM